MSLDATRWAWLQDVSPAAKLVLLSLSDRAGENHTCYPSIARLSADTGMDRKTVMRALDGLELSGLIVRERSQGSVNRYRLIGVSGREDEQATSTKIGTSTKNGTSTKIGSGVVPKLGHVPVPILGHESTIESTIEPEEPWCAHSAPTPPTADRPPDKSRGTRLPEDWRPDDELVAWALDRGVSSRDMDRETERFRNYWLDKPGAAGRKVGWRRTWQNWIIRSQEDNRGNRGQHRKDIDLDDTSWLDESALEYIRAGAEYGEQQRNARK